MLDRTNYYCFTCKYNSIAYTCNNKYIHIF